MTIPFIILCILSYLLGYYIEKRRWNIMKGNEQGEWKKPNKRESMIIKRNLKELKTTEDFMREKPNVLVERSDIAYILNIIIPILEELEKQMIELGKRPKN